jgi:hypothetical protein
MERSCVTVGPSPASHEGKQASFRSRAKLDLIDQLTRGDSRTGLRPPRNRRSAPPRAFLASLAARFLT